MRSSVFLQSLAAVCIAAAASTVSGQTAIQLFSPVDVRVSLSGTGYGTSENVFNTTTLNLSCPSSISAVISGTANGSGNVLVDNFITFNLVGGTPTNICTNGTMENGTQQNCFNSTYGSQASSGELTGQNPDTFVSSGGVPPINVSSLLKSGTVQAQIGLVDTGYYLDSSTLYLVTNCTSNGVAGPGKVSGNPIPQSNPNDQQLTQNFAFNSTSNQQVQFTYDLSEAQGAGTLSITDGTTPSGTDNPLNAATFQSTYLRGTSFATGSCLIHSGELYNGAPACKLYTLTCQVGTNPAQSGVYCPTSQQRNELFEDVFDGPKFTLPDVFGYNGVIYHQGVGFLEAKEGWSGGPCVFDPASSIASQLCPQNLLTSFTGPGAYKGGGRGESTNSTFITVAPVPEDLTSVSVPGQRLGYWINSHSFKVNFQSVPPALLSKNNFVAAPIQSITYGITPPSSVPQPGPINPDDVTVPNSVACPAPGGGNSPKATTFTLQGEGVSVPQDGQYLLHYYAQDCAGTEELKFTNTGGSWATSFYTYPINVDATPPVIQTGPTLSPAPTSSGYQFGQKVTATYSCTDNLSGVLQCGAGLYLQGKLSTGTITSLVNTNKTGQLTFTVTAVDAAGNTTTSAPITYTVNAPGHFVR
jgi:hypothetical protein